MPKGSKYEQVWENEDGWSDWFYPEMEGYEMACCDCWLIHKVQFIVVERTATKKDGQFVPRTVRNKKLQVGMRVGRNNRATANARRARKGDQDG